MKTLASHSPVLFLLLLAVPEFTQTSISFPEECEWSGGKCQVARCLLNWREIGKCSRLVPCCTRNIPYDGRFQSDDNIH
ncbi:beta-defensin 4-like [Sceloporus undulatus]|uniref:beta-defensin 4-like n=1 Tax=Sceloporus undulatus TaxID=8520 RepID=UPI001C4ADFD4|nr:beta-defensin 4-like [Sceloporus undulatus]